MAVTAKKLTSTGVVNSSNARVLGVHIEATGVAGSVTLKDGGGSGTTKLDIGLAAAAGNHYVPVTGGGIDFATDVHAILANVTSITVIYEDL
ncbi:MAG: hypothetical protein CMN85_10880 [Spongiibacteraceae bacterium]|uniref:hypothetical protein n=1 Tax=uncultured Haliea sp. TaxID=622616 RepID=UPI000C63E519|nr:hypothetical protein [Spongiibacteraceae bacterium]|tara:strand:+ start:22083 stop:22358 length:276 start_codon:yes stop_codon:yes gene_type:complete